MIEQADVVVVGGGIVGTAAAFHLAERDVETVLVDAERPGRATDAGAGIISPSTSSRRENEDWFAFAVEAAAHYRTLVRNLETQGIDDHGYRETEMLSVAVDESEIPGFEADLERVERRQAESHAPFEGTVEQLSPAEATAAFPPLADVERAMRFSSAARVDGKQFTAGLRRAAGRTGLETVEGTVAEILVEDDAVSGVVVDATGADPSQQQRTAGETERIDADHVIVAGGAWSNAFGEDLGLALPVEPMRGQILHLDTSGTDAAPESASDEWAIVGGYRENYLVPWADGRIVIGATREEGVGFDPRVTAGGLDEVTDAAMRMAPGLEDATFEEMRVGLRPGSPDGIPMVGAVPAVDGAYVATGHGPTGLTLGPYSGKVVADLVTGEKPEVDISAFAPERF
ncbi:MAG: FAD-dependent oxidoreductase [Halolamina sp.]|uniref:NAD(P)/FAD-dependent oxidoreductase n=1 Tax=Halolamina sp. TaxID=1940283 RepID=UPI002FC2E378